jgi:hypothetical protein
MIREHCIRWLGLGNRDSFKDYVISTRYKEKPCRCDMHGGQVLRRPIKSQRFLAMLEMTGEVFVRFLYEQRDTTRTEVNRCITPFALYHPKPNERH